MKFLTLENGQLGALVERTVVDITSLTDNPCASSLSALIVAGDSVVADAWAIARKACQTGDGCRPYNDVRPKAPIPVPRRNIFCIGKNYLEHAREVGEKMQESTSAPESPIFFTKATTAITATGEQVHCWPEITSMLDYEAEVALIIGTGGRNIPAENAWQHVFGYTAINDISARDLQREHHQWFRAKSLDGFAPMGPVVVHRSSMPALCDIVVQCTVNGELRQKATFDQLLFDVPTIIEVLSSGMTLLPGDIIATGTPSGVGMGFSPPRYLHAGDEMVVEITGVGELRNTVG